MRQKRNPGFGGLYATQSEIKAAGHLKCAVGFTLYTLGLDIPIANKTEHRQSTALIFQQLPDDSLYTREVRDL